MFQILILLLLFSQVLGVNCGQFTLANCPSDMACKKSFNGTSASSKCFDNGKANNHDCDIVPGNACCQYHSMYGELYDSCCNGSSTYSAACPGGILTCNLLCQFCASASACYGSTHSPQCIWYNGICAPYSNVCSDWQSYCSACNVNASACHGKSEYCFYDSSDNTCANSSSDPTCSSSDSCSSCLSAMECSLMETPCIWNNETFTCSGEKKPDPTPSKAWIIPVIVIPIVIVVVAVVIVIIIVVVRMKKNESAEVFPI